MNKIMICILSVLLMGCASMTSIEKNYSILDTSDGVNMKEAVVIAQKYCLDKVECNGDVRLSTPRISDQSNEWAVEFWSKNVLALDHAYVVVVDKKSGEIVEAKFAL